MGKAEKKAEKKEEKPKRNPLRRKAILSHGTVLVSVPAQLRDRARLGKGTAFLASYDEKADAIVFRVVERPQR